MPLSGHDNVTLLNDVANDAESTQNSIITSYLLVGRVNQLGKLINTIPGLRLFISSLPDFAMSTGVLKALPGELDIKRHPPSILYILASITMSTGVLKALPGKLDIIRHLPSILYISRQALRCQQAFSKPCLANLMS